MKNKIITTKILILMLLSVFSGCKDKAEIGTSTVVNDVESVLYSTWSAAAPDATIYIRHMSGFGIVEYHLNGYFYNGTTNQTCANRVDVGSVKLDSTTLSKAHVSENCVTYGLVYPETRNDYSSLFGGLTNVDLTGGSGYTGGNEDIYTVQTLGISSLPATGSVPNFPSIEVVSKSSGYTVTWNADLNNPSGDVVVLLKYSKSFTKEVDSSLSAGTYTHHIITADDGSYTISSQDLSSFPVNSYIELYVGRGSYKQWDNNGKIIDIVAITRDNQDFVLTQ
jgi:hypothetical protein